MLHHVSSRGSKDSKTTSYVGCQAALYCTVCLLCSSNYLFAHCADVHTRDSTWSSYDTQAVTDAIQTSPH